MSGKKFLHQKSSFCLNSLLRTKIKVPMSGKTRKRGPSHNSPLIIAVTNQKEIEDKRITQPDKVGLKKNKIKPAKIPVKETI